MPAMEVRSQLPIVAGPCPCTGVLTPVHARGRSTAARWSASVVHWSSLDIAPAGRERASERTCLPARFFCFSASSSSAAFSGSTPCEVMLRVSEERQHRGLSFQALLPCSSSLSVLALPLSPLSPSPVGPQSRGRQCAAGRGRSERLPCDGEHACG